MLALLDCCAEDFTSAPGELGETFTIGQLLTPLTRRAIHPDVPLAIDNGAFAGFDVDGFNTLLARAKPERDRCLFVVAPDVVGSARRTLEVFRYWYPRLDGRPIALACQDGQEDLDIPWQLIQAVFIGGSTNWKMSKHAEQIIYAARAMGKWTHVGRVNTPIRVEKFAEVGVHSIDGTGMSRYSHMRKKIAAAASEQKLFAA